MSELLVLSILTAAAAVVVITIVVLVAVNRELKKDAALAVDKERAVTFMQEDRPVCGYDRRTGCTWFMCMDREGELHFSYSDGALRPVSKQCVDEHLEEFVRNCDWEVV